MAFKVFLDANILLDFMLKRDSYDESKQMLELVVQKRIQAYITSSIVHIVGYYLAKAYGSRKAKDLILSLLTEIYIIDITHEVTVNALHSKINDIEDALQYYTALHHKLDYFISRDQRLQKESIPILPVYTPGAFLEEIWK